MKKKFGTVLNCIDGRTQIPAIKWLQENFDVDYVDSITEPGMDKALSKGQLIDIEKLKDKVIISVTAHNSSIVAIVGHYGCAAHPVSDYEHFQDILASMDIVKSWNLPVEVVGVWVDEFWSVHVVNM